MDDILGDLARAGLATHVVETVPGSGVGEADLVAALLDAVPGRLFRVGPCRFAAAVPPGAADKALADLTAALGEGAVALRPLPPADDASAGAPVLSLLRALSDATGYALAAEGPRLRAVLDAEFAVSAARMTAEGLGGLLPRDEAGRGIADRLDRIEAGLEALSRRLESGAVALEASAALERRLDAATARLEAAGARTTPDHVASFARFSTALQTILRRLDGQVAAVEAMAERLAHGLGADAAAGAPERLADELAALRDRLARLDDDAAGAAAVRHALAEVLVRLGMTGTAARPHGPSVCADGRARADASTSP